MIENLNGELAALRDSLQNEQSANGDLSATVTDLQETNAVLITERDDAHQAIELFETRLLDAGKEIGSLTDSGHELQKQIDSTAAAAQADRDATTAVRTQIQQSIDAAGLTAATVDSIEDDSAVSIVLGSGDLYGCLLYTSPSPRDGLLSRMPSSA